MKDTDYRVAKIARESGTVGLILAKYNAQNMIYTCSVIGILNIHLIMIEEVSSYTVKRRMFI